MSNIEYLKEKLKETSIELTEIQMKQFLTYYEMLVEKNKVMNLTAITEFEEVVEKHFIDSLMLVKAVDLKKENYKLLDLGTGAGFPGIPLKIAYPNLEIVLVDSLNKRVKFLAEVIEALQLKNITAVHGRAEDLAKKKEYREQFDYCVSRAVANLSTLSEYCVPFVKIGGNFISYKAGNLEEELENAKNPIKILGGKVENVIEFSLPGTEVSRSFVVVGKKKETAKKYPRNAGKPNKEPLK